MWNKNGSFPQEPVEYICLVVLLLLLVSKTGLWKHRPQTTFPVKSK